MEYSLLPTTKEKQRYPYSLFILLIYSLAVIKGVASQLDYNSYILAMSQYGEFEPVGLIKFPA